ncbi:putative beta-1,4-xylosyltransferase IRX14 [Curcuma longa]|uniref:putative beta-1,4-xylosyltransferase IRX14 n=1 Tax=Curcuma longa TaxID=136217 RepID=UPI003D9E9707
MKQSSLHHQNQASRRAGGEVALRSPSALFWIVLHAVCCLVSLALGFRFSRVVFFLFFSSSTSLFTSAPLLHTVTTTTTTNITTTTTTTTTTRTLAFSFPPPPLPPAAENRTRSRVVVGRQGIRIRPWPRPNPAETMRAHSIIERVQREQRLRYGGVETPRPLIVVTPTYVRTFQALHLTGLIHSLLLVPYPLTWIVVEAAAPSAEPPSGETAALLARSGLRYLHVRFPDPMPDCWPDRRLTEARMRLRALRMIREERMDGVVVFADDSNVHSTELFEEAQKVNWIGAVSVGILADTEQPSSPIEAEEKNPPVPIQGPACNSSGDFIGWQTFNSLTSPEQIEWAGFLLNSRLVWREAKGKPEWARDLDAVSEEGEEMENPLALLKDTSPVEPLGNCGKKVLLWWLRAEASSGSKFPPRWIIDPPTAISAAGRSIDSTSPRGARQDD